MIDLNIIQKGEDYKALKKSYIIFICLKDPFDQGLHLYTFENRCNQKLDLVLGDDTVKVFLNASGTEKDVSPQLADFLIYLTEKKGETALVKKIDAEVKKARAHEEWKVEYMTLQMKFHDIYDEGHEAGWDEGHGVGYNEGRDDGYDAGTLETRLSLITKKLAKGKTILQIADELEETEENIRQLIEEHHLMEKR